MRDSLVQKHVGMLRRAIAGDIRVIRLFPGGWPRNAIVFGGQTSLFSWSWRELGVPFPNFTVSFGASFASSRLGKPTNRDELASAELSPKLVAFPIEYFAYKATFITHFATLLSAL